MRDALRNVVNLSGSINADSATGDGGTIVLIAGGDPSTLGGALTTTGTLSARATGTTGNGGSIETSGETVNFAGTTVDTSAAHGRTGTWLIDPTDVTINSADAATIQNGLASSNFSVQTQGGTVYYNNTATTTFGTQDPNGNGDITVAAPITWTSGNQLTINADRNIAINAAITGTSGTLLLAADSAQNFVGVVTQTAAIKVGTLNANGVNIVLTNSGNQVGTLTGGRYGNITFVDNVGTLTLSSIQAGVLSVVNAGGGIAQNGPINALLLTGSSAGAANFTPGSGSTNVIQGLGAFTSAGAFTLNTAVNATSGSPTPLTISGPLNAAGQTVTLTVAGYYNLNTFTLTNASTAGPIVADAAITANIFNLNAGN